MNTQAKVLAVLLTAVLALCPIALSADTDAEGPSDGILLYQVSFGDTKGVAVHNYGGTAIDMVEYRISDSPVLTKEGYLSFSKGTVVDAYSTLVISSEDDGSEFSSQSNVIFYDDANVTKNKSFDPSKSKDDIYLIDSKGNIVDAVFYGSMEADDVNWIGKAVEKRGDLWIQRHSSYDSNTANDWFVYVYGQTGYEFDPELKYDATVTPFLFPDSGGIPILRALESAQDSVRIEMYQLMNMNVLALLCDLLERGVDVQILLEGGSLASGYDPLADPGEMFKKIIELGGEIRVIGVSDDGNDRFDFDHAKFALIDGDTTIVTSENWTPSNVNGDIDEKPYVGTSDGNRGWGVIIESVRYHDYMEDVFLTDWSKEFGDVKDLLDVKPHLVSGERDYVSPTYTGTFPSFEAKVTPVLSNDNSYDALRYYAMQAEERLYSQQQSLGSSYEYFDASSPLGMFSDKAVSGVDTRLMFGTNVDTEVVTKINSEAGIKTATFERPSLHNKGIIADDVAWVSSINWTSNSFHDNREVAVAIESKEVADFFAEHFLADFQQYYSYEGIHATIANLDTQYECGTDIVFEVSVQPEGDYRFVWNFGDGSPTKTTEINRIAYAPEDGTHTLQVRVYYDDNLYVDLSQKYTVGGSSESGGTDVDIDGITALLEDKMYILAPIIVILLGLLAAVKRHR